MKELILASASKRRFDLLKNTGYSFKVIVSDVDESPVIGLNLSPYETVKELSRIKAESVMEISNTGSVILAADTIVVIDNTILGKPESKDDAFRMLTRLSGKAHSVYTAVTIIETGGSNKLSFVEKADVYMAKLTGDEITAYINTGQPLDKAGSYGIQGIGGLFVERIEGDFFSIEGLPINKVYSHLKDFGIYPAYTNIEYI